MTPDRREDLADKAALAGVLLVCCAFLLLVGYALTKLAQWAWALAAGS